LSGGHTNNFETRAESKSNVVKEGEREREKRRRENIK
jgi:hypothetical protein